MAELQLYGRRGGVALIDDEDVELVSGPHWYQYRSGHVGRSAGKGEKPSIVLLHRMILPTALDVDHINRNKLDNRKCNLRPATHAQNCRNRGIYSSNTSGYKGVYWDKDRQKYQARVKFNFVYYFGGRYDTAREAAEAYNALALHYHGEFALLNVLD